jgi:hypothetical protein
MRRKKSPTEFFFGAYYLFGGDLEADLPYGSKFRWSAEYLPSVKNWTDNYIIRTNADWTMPIIGWMNFKISVINIYNNRPAFHPHHSSGLRHHSSGVASKPAAQDQDYLLV